MQKSKQHRKNALTALGNAIRNHRIDRGLSQQELGIKAELHRTHITEIEGGLRNISFLTLLRVAYGLDCSLTELIGTAESLNELRK